MIYGVEEKKSKMLKKYFKNNKKGSLQDLLLIGVVLLFFGVVVLIGFKMATEFNTHIQASTDIPAVGKTASNQLTGYYSSTIDNAFLFLTIGLSIVTLILAALVRVHPVFLVIFIFGFIILIFLCGIFSNIYDEMASNAELSTQADQLTFISLILSRLPIIVGIIGTLLIIVLYKVWNV